MIISEISKQYVGIVLKDGLYANSIVYKDTSSVIEDLASKVTITDYSKGYHKYAQIIHDIWQGSERSCSMIEIDYSNYTLNEIKILKELRGVKRGKTISYGDLAQRSGFLNGARFVGNVMKKNRCPLVVPCHRVTKKNSIGNYFYGENIKKQLLESEGALL